MLMRPILLAMAAVATLPITAQAEPWRRAYVAEWMEPAWYFPGQPGGEAAPGKDCPKGANPGIDKRNALKTSYRTWEEVDKILDPEKPQWTRYGGIRGPNGENVYEKPWLVPDTKQLAPVQTDLAEGFDLDGNPRTGFKNADGGKPGVDNSFYRIAGCWIAYRGPERRSQNGSYANEFMRNGRISIVMVVSGQGADPDNDPNVKVAFHFTSDQRVTGPVGQVLPNYSFRISADPRFQSLAEARTVSGVIESKVPSQLKLHDLVNAGFFPPQLVLERAQFRFKPDEGGAMRGLIGGYQAIDAIYTPWAAAGSTHESVVRIDIPALWHALRRSADYKLSPNSKENDGISTAFRFYWVPARAIEPDATREVTEAKLYLGAEDPKLSRQVRPSAGGQRRQVADTPAQPN